MYNMFRRKHACYGRVEATYSFKLNFSRILILMAGKFYPGYAYFFNKEIRNKSRIEKEQLSVGGFLTAHRLTSKATPDRNWI